MFKCFSFIFLTPFSFSLIEQPVENPKSNVIILVFALSPISLHTHKHSYLLQKRIFAILFFLCLGLGWPQDPSAWGNSSALRSLTAFSSNLSMRAAIAPTALGQHMYSIFHKFSILNSMSTFLSIKSFSKVNIVSFSFF